MEIFARHSDNAVYHAWQEVVGGWSGWAALGGLQVQGDVAVGRNDGGTLELFARGIDNGVYHRWQVSPGGAWNGEGWVIIPNNLVGGNVAVCRNGDGCLEVFVRDSINIITRAVQATRDNHTNWKGWDALGSAFKCASEIAAVKNTAGRVELFCRRAFDNSIYHLASEPG
ncbi:hypothetical protein [Streptomyces solaniscabiei]|uniref:hypothetical protein n=1 Tax=Streptomyces solaniscabiei TaxID=2683255 RepID=UPI001CE33D71|nr:hypothetical protein [Streptomyces solaniscabiei]